MPQKKTKKPKPPSERHPTTLRFSDADFALVDADRKAMPGIPVSHGAYCKHAVMSYPKLRKLEDEVRRQANGGEETVSDIASDLLTEAGL